MAILQTLLRSVNLLFSFAFFKASSKRFTVIILLALLFTQLRAQDCDDDALYVTPNGSGMGTKLSPAGLLTALAIVNSDTSRHLIKLGMGTYEVGQTLVVPSNVTIDGSYDATNGLWKKGPVSSCVVSISPPGEEIKTKDAIGNTVTVGHYIGIMLDTVENVRLKDFTLQVHKRNDFYADMTLAGDGKSIYGIYGRSSHDIFFINLHIMTDDGGEGMYGYKGLDGASAYYYIPGRTVYDPGKTNSYQPRPAQGDEVSYAWRAGGDGGLGGRIQDYYRCLDCASSALSSSTYCAAEFPLPRGGRGGKNGGLGGEAGDNCEMDCYYEYYKSKTTIAKELLDLLSLPGGGSPKDPTPDPGGNGQDGTGSYNGGDYTDQTLYPYDDLVDYYIPGNGAKGGDGSGGSGGGGGGAGGIRTLGLVPTIPGLGDYNYPAKMLGVFNKAITLIGGDDVCHAEIVNGSTEGGRGGAGGEGGEGGGGGHGGGASIGIYMPRCPNVVDRNCAYTIGQGGDGGFGGYGGKGGDGGLGLPGRPVGDGGWSYQGAKGGNGGKGGDGSRGQHGKPGRSYTKIGPTTKPQPFIMSDIATGCTNSVISVFTSGEPVFNTVTRSSNDVNLVQDKPSGTTFSPFKADMQVVALDTGRLPVSLMAGGYPQAPVQVKTIRPLPSMSVPSVLCLGDTLKVSTGETSAQYSWKIFNANEEVIYSSAKKSTAFVPTSIGTYTVGFQAYDICCGYSAPQYRTVRVSTVSKPVIENLEAGLTYCYGSDSSRYNVTSNVSPTDVLRWSNGSTGTHVYIKEGGWHHVVRTTADGCSAKSDSIWNRVLALPQGKPTVKDLYGLCSGAETTIFPDDEPGMLYSFYYQGSSKDDRALVPGGAHTPYATLRPVIQQASASYFVRKVSAIYIYSTPFYCTGDEVQEVKLYKETLPPVIISDNIKHDLAVDRTNPGCGTYYTYDYPKAADNCSPYVSVTARHMAANHFYPIGTTVDTLRYIDVSGNFIDYAIPITVHDVTPPVITKKPVARVDINNEPGTCGAYYPFTLAMASDNCTTLPELNGVMPQFVTSQDNGYADLYYISGGQDNSVFRVGNNVIRQTWADAAGNTTTFEQTIVVKDTEAPKLQGTDITYYVAKDKSTAYTGYNAPKATDNCSTVLTSTFVSGFGQSGEHGIGTSREIWKAVDDSGNEGFASFNIVVLDTISPSIDCSNVRPAAYAVAGSDEALITFSLPVALDNSGSVTVTTSGPGSGAYYKLGIHHLPYVATDNSGNTASCMVTVTVMDVEAPKINCPSDIKVANDPGLCGAVINFAIADALDNDGSYYRPFQVLGQASGTVFPVGSTLLAFKVADAGGNTNTCGFEITVEDTEAPVFTNCPGKRTEFVAPELCGKSVLLAVPAATDNSCNPPSVGFVSGSAGGFFPLGITHQVYRARDNYGNVATCEFDVEVVDNTTLIATCPRDVQVNTTPGLCGAVVLTTAPTTNVNYGCLTWRKTSAYGNGDLFVPGEHTVTYQATALGQTASCSYKVTVVDVEGPKITQPDNIVVSLDNGACGKVVTFPQPDVKDNCTNHFLQQTAGLPSGSVFPVGTTVQKFIAFDNTHSTSVTFTVTVLDNTAPTFAGVTDITEISADICGKVITFMEPAATDNSSCITVTRVKGLSSGDLFPIGTTQQVYVARDAAGNTDTTRFVITVSGDRAQFNACPPDVVVMSDNGQTKEVWYDVPGQISCSGVTALLISGKGSGATFPAGATRETYLITDPSGHTDTCSFKVFVAEHVAPIVDCSSFITLELDDAICGAKVKLPTPDVNDFGGSGLQTIFNDKGPLDSTLFFPAGYSQVIWTAIDQSGNRNDCVTTIQVGKDEAPLDGFSSRVTVCEGSALEINPRMSGEGPYVYQWVYFDPVTFEMKVVSTDSIFRIPNVQLSDARQYMFAVTSPCNVDIYRREFLLTVNPAPKVTLTGLDAGYCEYEVAGEPVSYSPVGGILTGDGFIDGKFYPSKAGVGQHTVTYTYHDDALGCPATASLKTEVFKTPVVDAFIDTAYCVNNVVLQLDGTNSTYAGPGISGTTFNAAVAQAGTHTITRTVKVNGCVSSRSADVKIQGNVPDASIVTAGPICSNKTRVTLESVAAGGTWSGANVRVDSARNASYFNVKAAELGEHKVYYKMVDNVCVSIDSVTLTVVNSAYSLPFTFNAYCYDQGLVALDASDNKNYFGYGITNNKFNPAAYDTTTTALYGVSTVNANGCIDTVWRAMAVLKPELIDPLRLVCKRGDEAVLSVDTQMASVTWFDNTVTYTKTVYDTGSYTVELRNTTGCVKMDTFLVDSKQAHLPPLINNTHQLYKCVDATATLTAGGNYVNYVWANGTAGQSLTVSSAGEYKIYVKDDTGCELYDSIQVNNYPTVTNNQLANNGTYLEAIPSTAYVWYRDGLPVDGASGQTLPVTESGSYYVMITDGNGCQSASDTLQVVLTAIEGETHNAEFMIYPNPSKGKYVFEFKARPSADLDIVLINTLGQIVQQFGVGSQSGQSVYPINIESQPAGVYWALIKRGDQTTVVKLVKVD